MTYDNNGNITQDGSRRFTYSSYDLVTNITQGGESTRFKYDANRQRFERYDVKVEAGVTSYLTTLYVGGYEKVTRSGGNKPALTEQKLYVGNLVITKRSNNTVDEFYLHKDHQGSTTTITNKSGNVVQQFTYDPWGKQTAAYSHSLLNDYIAPAASKGYTGHEGIDNLNLIHMNGRIYDPTIGRFLQADPHIQAPTNTQSYNRYSYVLNNPMSYSDPSGFFFKKIGEFFKKFWKPIVAVIVTVVTYGAASGWVAGWGATWGTAATTTSAASLTTAGAVATGAIAGAAGGFAGGALATGSLRGALKGAFSGAIAGAAGGYANFGSVGGFGDVFNRIGVVALGGCAAGAASGGNCSQGAKLAVIAQGLKIAMDKYSGYESSWNTSKENAVIKLEGTGVENANVSNTGTSVEVKVGSDAVRRGLVGRDVSTLNAKDLEVLKSSLAKPRMDFFDWSPAENRVIFDTSNVNYWMSEYSPVLQWSSENVGGFRAFSVFHDKWMAKWNIQNNLILATTIPPAIAAQYYALGLENHRYYLTNQE
ncbi:RHS repeat domain-containing protein [Shewanella algae]